MRRCRPLALVPLLLLPACIAERPAAGLHYQGRPVGGPSPVLGAGAPVPALPLGPVASPVLDATFSSSMRAEVVPLGSVEYDGQVLPLVSPDGRFIAVEEGQPPTWPTLLGATGAAPPLATRVAVHDISVVPARTVAFARPLPRGLMLGRSADDAGFLVEAPQPDGARWIGRVRWISGDLEWLVKNPRVNAHGVFTSAGSLAYIARDAGSDQGELVLRAADGSETVRSGEGESHLFPVASPEPGIVCSLARTQAGLELLAWSLDAGDGSEAVGQPERLGSIVARVLVCPGGDAALAYQIVAPAPQVLPRRSGDVWRGERPAIFHPQFGRMAEFDRSSGGFALLPERSIAAARAGAASGADGWFVAVPEGLIFSPDSARPTQDSDQHRGIKYARVDPVPYVPRQTSNPDRPLILFGPAPRIPNRLVVLALRFIGPEGSGQ